MFNGRRFIVGKMGLDSHDNGLRIIANWLATDGNEVIYAGLYNTPNRIVQMAIEEDVDAIGVSFLGGGHLYYTRELINALQKKDMDHVKIIIGGVIPPDDVREIKSLGVDAVFTPGTTKKNILDTIEALFG